MRWILLATLVATAVFLTFPDLDLTLSGLFYSPETKSFPLLNNPLLLAMYYLVYVVTYGTGGGLLAMFAVLHLKARYPRLSRFAVLTRRQTLYLTLAVILGPGIAVHWGIKEYYGRARPLNVVEFGGKDTYTPPFVVSSAGGKSFVSGHSAMGFYFTAFGLAATGVWRRRLYLGGFSFGVLAALARVMQGKHFVSDVLFGALLVLLLNHLLARWMLKKREDVRS